MMVFVQCKYCGEEFVEDTVELDDIYSDELGRDIVRFTCPKCGEYLCY